MKGLLQRLFKGGDEDKPITYDEAKEMARDKDTGVRRDLAARSDVTPEILYYLAEDADPDVRRVIATNIATPVQADVMLASDADEMVRGDLARKIASLAPGLNPDEQGKVEYLTYQALEVLARDQVTRVRQIISEALKDVADAPPEVIRQLAWDAELVVAGPVLQYSPVLNSEDLLEIIKSSPATGRLGAISSRDGLMEPVADAIIATEDEEAIALLLGNESAQIREETLDDLIDRALDVESWHEPLVNRPILPSRAAAKLARFVAHNLLSALSQRHDLEPDVLEEVCQVVDKRLREEPPELPEDEKTTAEEALEKVKRLQAAGTLDEPTIVKAARSGDREFAIAALAVLAELKVAVIRKAVSSKSAKGMVAIVWKAGLSAMAAVTLQGRLALVPQKELLRAKGGDYPLDEAAMEWQLDFIKDIS